MEHCCVVTRWETYRYWGERRCTNMGCCNWPEYSYYGYHAGTVHDLAWSPDGKYIAIGSDNTTVLLWEIATIKNIYNYTGHITDVFAVAWSPDGKRIASGAAVNSLAWSPDGKHIASASSDSTVQVWQPM